MISLQDFGWRHAGRKNPALRDINLTIHPGEKVLLLGASGSGKSTLLAAIAGVLGDDSEGHQTGSALIDGNPCEHTRGTVGLVLQDPDSQVIAARVGDDVAFGAENLRVPRDEIWRRVQAALDTVGLRVPLEHPTAQLSGGQKQRLALAGVLAMGAKVICLDEPTANIDPDGVAEVRDAAIAAADRTGAALVVVEHRVDAWVEHVDRIVVIGADDDKPGATVLAEGSPRRILNDYHSLLEAAGVWIPGHPPQLPEAKHVATSSPAAVTTSTPAAIAAHQLQVGYTGPVHTPIDLQIHRGASCCIVGPNGTGKSTLALTLGGLLKPISGTIDASGLLPRSCSQPTSGWRHRRKAKDLDPNPGQWSSKALAQRIGNVFQAPEHQFVTPTVRQELELGPKQTGDETGLARVDELLELLRLSHLAAANPFTLSGGEKRRLSVATVLATAPAMLILDEPTFGQDRNTFVEVVTLLRRLADEQGTTVVSITHDPLVVQALGDQVIDLGAAAA